MKICFFLGGTFDAILGWNAFDLRKVSERDQFELAVIAEELPYQITLLARHCFFGTPCYTTQEIIERKTKIRPNERWNYHFIEIVLVILSR